MPGQRCAGLGDRDLFVDHAQKAESNCAEVKYPPVNTQFVLATLRATRGDASRNPHVSHGMHYAVNAIMEGGD